MAQKLFNIGTTANGGPDFSGTEYLYKTNIGQANIVTIKMTGSRRKDFTQAFDNANTPKSMRKTIREDFTWHHVDDFNPLTGESKSEGKIMYSNKILGTKDEIYLNDLKELEKKFNFLFPQSFKDHYLMFNGRYLEK